MDEGIAIPIDITNIAATNPADVTATNDFFCSILSFH
jgi:hypothetical protein